MRWLLLLLLRRCDVVVNVDGTGENSPVLLPVHGASPPCCRFCFWGLMQRALLTLLLHAATFSSLTGLESFLVLFKIRFDWRNFVHCPILSERMLKLRFMHDVRREHAVFSPPCCSNASRFLLERSGPSCTSNDHNFYASPRRVCTVPVNPVSTSVTVLACDVQHESPFSWHTVVWLVRPVNILFKQPLGSTVCNINSLHYFSPPGLK